MFCPNCGASIDDTAAFCANCGEKIAAPAAVEPEPEPAAEPAEEPVAEPEPAQETVTEVETVEAAPAAAIESPRPVVANNATSKSTESNGLRLAAFVINVITCVACCWLILPLAWMIPMTVRSYGIYKGTKPNTVAFGVCTLLFVDLISGILLLCSEKDA